MLQEGGKDRRVVRPLYVRELGKRRTYRALPGMEEDKCVSECVSISVCAS